MFKFLSSDTKIKKNNYRQKRIQKDTDYIRDEVQEDNTRDEYDDYKEDNQGEIIDNEINNEIDQYDGDDKKIGLYIGLAIGGIILFILIIYGFKFLSGSSSDDTDVNDSVDVNGTPLTNFAASSASSASSASVASAGLLNQHPPVPEQKGSYRLVL